MAIHLHYIDSVVPHLGEVLSSLAKKHMAFKLQDTFKILCPDSQTTRDIEAQLLEYPELGEVLIGNSVLSWPQFFDLALESHRNRRPVASFPLEAKALHLVLKSEGLNFGSQALRQTLAALKRHAYLAATQEPGQNPSPIHPWFEKYQTWIKDKFSAWTTEQAWQEVLDLLATGQCGLFRGVKEVFFLGFPYPDGNLFRTIMALENAHPEINQYVFFPPIQNLSFGETYLAKSLESLEKRATERIHHKNLGLPQLEFELYPTSWHEAQAILNQAQGLETSTAYLLASRSPTQNYLRSWLGQECFFPKNPSKDALQLLEASLSLLPGRPIPFREYFSGIFDRLEKKRQSLARMGNALALKYWGHFYNSLLAISEVETQYEEIHPAEYWVQMLTETLQEPMEDSGDWGGFRDRLRNWRKPGLKTFQNLWLASLNETSPGASHGVLDLPSTYGFDLFEENILLRRALFQSQSKVRLSWVGHDMSGRVLSPAAALSHLKENLALPESKLDQVLSRQEHPYFQENLERERTRLNGPPGIDGGNLQSETIREKLRDKLKARALSPSYIDDFAHCPWKFLARWHFRVDTQPEEALEIDPRLRGRWAHQLLETFYKKSMNQFFRKGQLPTQNEIESLLSESAAEIEPKLPQSVDFPLHPEILADEWIKIQQSVLALSQTELRDWSEEEDPYLPFAVEWSFGLPPKAQVPIPIDDKESIALGGVIDRVDYQKNSGRFLVIDYKSSQTDVMSKAIREGLSYQLLIYQWAVQQALLPQAEGVGGLYWDLKQLKKNQGMVKSQEYQAHKKRRGASKSFLKTDAYEQQYQFLMESLKEKLKQIRLGAYLLDPPSCQGSQCTYFEICRYQDKPDG